VKAEGKVPGEVDAAICAYDMALAQLKPRIVDTEAKVLEVLVARESLHRLIGEGAELSTQQVSKIVDLDKQLKGKVALIDSLLEPNTFANWRDAVVASDNAWWWHLDVRAAVGPKLNIFFLTITWLVIAVSLGFIVEILRRLLSGGSDSLSAVLQGLLAFLVGSTIVQYARQLVEQTSPKTSAGKAPLRWKRRLVWATFVVAIAIILGLSQPRIASYYNGLANEDLDKGMLTSAIQNYQRAVSLKPDYAVAHYGLAKAYEAVQEYDKAITEYQTAILADNKEHRAYLGLSRLYMLHRKDFIRALQLLEIVRDRPPEALSEEEKKPNYQYTVFKNCGWAYFNLQYLQQAKDDLDWAVQQRADGAAAHYLLGKVYEAMAHDAEAKRKNYESQREAAKMKQEGDNAKKYADEAKHHWIRFLEVLNQQRDQLKEVETDWVTDAQEKVGY